MSLRNAKWCLFGCFIVFLSRQEAKTQVRIEISKDTFCLVGDTLTLPIKVQCNAATNIQQLDLQDWATLKSVKIISVNPTFLPDSAAVTEGGAYVSSLQIRLSDTGLNTLPPIRVLTNVGGTNLFTASDSLRIEVFSPQLADIKDIIKEPYDFWQDTAPMLVVVLSVFLAILIGFLFYQKQKNKKMEAPIQLTTRLEPHELALQRLEQLRKHQFWQQQQFKLFYSELTFIAREYLENRFGLPALENTTDELMQTLTNRLFLTQEIRQELKSLLELADLVKFATYEPTHVNHEKALDFVQNMVESSTLKIEVTT